MADKSKNRSAISKAFSIFGFAVTTVLTVLVVYFFIVKITGGIPSFFGYSLMNIVSPSMEDTIPVGSYILVKEIDPDELKEQDIITFYSRDSRISGLPNTHRIVEITEGEDGRLFTTKGDNNNVNDQDLVHEEDVIGIYCRRAKIVETIGSFLQNKWSFMIVIIIPIVIIMLYEILKIIKKSKEISNEEQIDSVSEIERKAIEEYKKSLEDKEKGENTDGNGEETEK